MSDNYKIPIFSWGGGCGGYVVVTTGALYLSSSKMNADQRVESPIPLLQISTPDAETEKLIKMKDDEVSVGGGGGRPLDK